MVYFLVHPSIILILLLNVNTCRAIARSFGQGECYPLAFGVPAILMTVALSIFFLGRASYVITIPKRNVLIDTSRCIAMSIRLRIKRWRDGVAGTESWLAYTLPR